MCVEQKSLEFKNCLAVIERLLEKKHCKTQIILDLFIKANKKQTEPLFQQKQSAK